MLHIPWDYYLHYWNLLLISEMKLHVQIKNQHVIRTKLNIQAWCAMIFAQLYVINLTTGIYVWYVYYSIQTAHFGKSFFDTKSNHKSNLIYLRGFCCN